jgi:peptide/nickel transport system permease protein
MKGKPISQWPLGFIVSTLIVLLLFLFGIINQWIEYDIIADVNDQRSFQPPSSDFIFGTDMQGRSIAMRLLKGVNAFFFPGLLAGLFAVLVGGALGGICGYMGGWTNRLISTLLELIDTLPRMVFLILICTIIEQPDMMIIAGVSSFLFIPSVATIIRRKVEALGSEDYILAHLAHGFHPFKIITYHILWLQCRSQLIRQFIFVFSYILFIETALSYLGAYGVQEPIPSWGNMVAQTKVSTVPWPWLFPAAAIVITISALMNFGNTIAQWEEEIKR